MIRIATEEDIKYLYPQSEAAVRIMGIAESYGISRNFIRFWCDEHRNLFISLIDGIATIVAETGTDFEELASFLSMQQDIRSIRTTESVAKKITKLCGFTADYGDIMTPGSELEQPSNIPETLPPKDIYPLLEACFGHLPPFTSWYADVSHRLRHGHCRIVGFKQDGIPVSCAMTTSECSKAAVIGAVATHKTARGRGYASSNVLTLANNLIRQGKKVFLSPKNQNAMHLYSNLGFVKCGRWANIKTTGRN